ncbi:MAG TPA: hypothetical protein VJ960_07450, partial [Oceanipulchritudo sp.]|nr:hypothetical protein [Oceanipulchritudo sp.]
MKRELHWNFPLGRPHAGMPLGNGLQGLLVRGEGATLRISIGQAGFWDRRGGQPFLPEVDYHEVRALLEERDEAGLEAAFGGAKGTPQPHQIGGGCLELEAGAGWVLLDGWIDLDEGRITVRWQCGSEERCLRIIQARGAGRSFIHWPEDLPLESIFLRPSWDWVGTDPAMAGCESPRRWQTETEWGFLQELPEDAALAVMVLRRPEGMALLSGVGVAVEDLRKGGYGLGFAAVEAVSEPFW